MFVRACFDGSAAFARGTAVPIAFSQLPKSIQRFRPDLANATAYRLTTAEIGFLITGVSTAKPKLRRCAVSSRKLSAKVVREEFIKRGFPAGLVLLSDNPKGSFSANLSYEPTEGQTANFTIGWDRLLGGWSYAETVVSNPIPVSVEELREGKNQ